MVPALRPLHAFVRLGTIGVAASIMTVLAGCAADPPVTSGDDAAVAHDAATGDASPVARDAATPASDAATPIVDAAEPFDASGVDASAVCVTYCRCLATNCPTKAIPGGCLAACSAQTKWDLSCRTGMCNIAKAEPNNNHCDHAVGIAECLDKP